MRILKFRDTAAPVTGSANTWTQGLMALSAATERHYLPFDGVGDYAVALNAATGVEAAGTAGEYCYLLKLNSADYGLFACAGALTDTSGSPADLTYGALAAHISTPTFTQYHHFAQAFSHAGANEGYAAYTYGTPDAPVVMAQAYANLPSVLSRGFFARGGAVLKASTFAPATPRYPEHVGVGTSISADLYPAGGHSLLQWVSCIVLNRWPTDGEVAAYSAGTCHDARQVWGDGALHGYWVASDASGTTIAPRVGSIPLTLVGGLNSDDLVSL